MISSRRLGTSNLVALVGALLIALAWADARPGEAQLFPYGDTLDEMEAEAERLALQQRAAEERQRQLQEMAEENRERWRDFQRTLRRSERTQRSEARRGESADMRNALTEAQRPYEVCLILMAIGEGRTAEQYLAQMQTRMRHDAPVQQGWLDVIEVRLEMLRRFGDNIHETRLERAIEQFEETLAQRLELTQNRRDRRLREQRHEALRAWMSSFAGYVQQRDSLLRSIEEDTFDAERIWNLAKLLANSLYLHSEARGWLDVLIEHCEEHWVVRSGLAHAGLAEVLARQGFVSRAQSLVRGCEGRAERFFDRVAEEADEVQRRVQTAQDEGRGLSLTPMERWLLQCASPQRRNQRRAAIRAEIRDFSNTIDSIATEYSLE